MRHASKLAHARTHALAHTRARAQTRHTYEGGRCERRGRAGVCMMGDMCCVCCAWLCVRCACVPMDMACTRMVSGAQVRADMPPPRPDEPGRPGKSCCGCCARLLESITRAACGHAPSPPGWSRASGQVMPQPAHARAQGVWGTWCACGACVRVCGARARLVCGARAVHHSPGTRRQRLHRRGRSSCSSCVVIVSSRFLCAAPAEERSGCAEESRIRVVSIQVQIFSLLFVGICCSCREETVSE